MAFLQLSKYFLEKSNQLKEEKNLYEMFGYNSHFKKGDLEPYKGSFQIDAGNYRSPSDLALSSLDKLETQSGLFLRNLDSTISVDKVKDHFSSIVPYGWPLKDHAGIITSPFGARFSPFERIVKYHTGVDLGAVGGTYIIASGDGVVEFANYRGDLGFAVIIRHDNNYSTRYAHMQQILVREGQSVKKGDVIGRVGLSGRTTGYHLHFEVRYKNEPLDPMPYIRDSQ